MSTPPTTDVIIWSCDQQTMGSLNGLEDVHLSSLFHVWLKRRNFCWMDAGDREMGTEAKVASTPLAAAKFVPVK